MKIRTNHRWREFKLREDVPEKILKSEFDWTNKDHALHCGYSDGFIEYKGRWYHLAQFVRLDGGVLTSAGWHAAHGDSFFSGVVIRLSSDGEQYQIGTYSE